MVTTSITIDDAGWGYLIGGIVLVASLHPSHEIVTRTVPLRYFQQPHFWRNGCREEITRLTVQMVRAVQWKSVDKVHVNLCHGNLFHIAQEELEGYGCRVERIVVAHTSPLQIAGEQAFARYLRRLCKYPYAYPGLEGKCLGSFSRAKTWLAEDLTRARWAKTGWGAWPKIYSEVQNARAIVDVAQAAQI